MHVFQKQIGSLTITISVNGDWSGDADVSVRRWEDAGYGEQRLVDRIDFPPIKAAALLAGRFEPRSEPTWGPRVLSLDVWGAVVAVAVFYDAISRATSALESLGPGGALPC